MRREPKRKIQPTNTKRHTNQRTPQHSRIQRTNEHHQNHRERKHPNERKYEKEQLTAEERAIIDERITAWKEGNGNEARILTIRLRKQMRKDRRKRLLDMVSKELDIRDKSMGLKLLRKGYQPIPCTLKTEEGKKNTSRQQSRRSS